MTDELKRVGEFLKIAADEVGLSAANNLMIVHKVMIVVILFKPDAMQQ